MSSKKTCRSAAALLLAIPLICLLLFAIYNIPPIHDRLSWRIDDAWARVYRVFRPPEQAIFVPQEEQIAADVQATLNARMAPVGTPETATSSPVVNAPAAVTQAQLPTETAKTNDPRPTNTPILATASPTATQTATPKPTATPTMIPAQVTLTGIVHEYQGWNNCGPATLSMTLTYWGWKGDQRDTAGFMKPNPDDKNTLPEEMVEYVTQKTDLKADLKALTRIGGDLDLLKRIIAAGFPVIIEKGFEPPKEEWMGHYEALSGYNDERGVFIAQDSYIMADLPVKYTEVQTYWQHFNYVFVIIYPLAREAEVMDVLGPQADETYNAEYAVQKALAETQTMTGRDQYFAWYNVGSSLVKLGDYAGAAAAYDQAFAIYPKVPEKERPWRMIWYQLGPYLAYYHTGRYTDVINLASTAINYMSEPAIEESFYWRAMARLATADTDGAIKDFQTTLKWHPGYAPALEQLKALGVEPEQP